MRLLRTACVVMVVGLFVGCAGWERTFYLSSDPIDEREATAPWDGESDRPKLPVAPPK